MTDRIKLDPSWKAVLAPEFETERMQALRRFLLAEKAAGKRIFPKSSLWFHALDATPLPKVRVVILGQDPYHGEGQAHGLCFSVPPGVRPPPSLVNIFKELETDLGIKRPSHGCLEYWAQQGVLLLNSVLTVEMASPASHQGKGSNLPMPSCARWMPGQNQPYFCSGAPMRRRRPPLSIRLGIWC
jgi:uracil-DNA glycosylase